MRSFVPIAVVAVMLWTLPACEEGEAGDAPPAPAGEAAEAPETDDGAEGAGEAEPEVGDLPALTAGQQRMHDRYGQVEAVRDAVVAGRLEEAKRQARGLDRPVRMEELPEAAGALRDAVPKHAAEIRDAAHVQGAARALAQTLFACGDCHARADTTWAWEVPELPPEEDLEHHMQRHAWGIARMWEGLMVGDAEHFDLGARTFAEASLVGDEPIAAEQEHPVGLGALANRLHRRAREAVDSQDMATRAAIFGDLLGDCASCHRRIRELDAQDAAPTH
ncbi:MAG: hypothetical protein ACODAU_01245 [Myxococcota bacterium]